MVRWTRWMGRGGSTSHTRPVLTPRWSRRWLKDDLLIMTISALKWVEATVEESASGRWRWPWLKVELLSDYDCTDSWFVKDGVWDPGSRGEKEDDNQREGHPRLQQERRSILVADRKCGCIICLFQDLQVFGSNETSHGSRLILMSLMWRWEEDRIYFMSISNWTLHFFQIVSKKIHSL